VAPDGDHDAVSPIAWPPRSFVARAAWKLPRIFVLFLASVLVRVRKLS
jgi:hypothetical protein